MSVEAEREWWDVAPAADIHGSPPYDVSGVASHIFTTFGASPWFALGCDIFILDLGCGVGRLTREMSERLVGPFSQLIGVDISASMIEEAHYSDDQGSSYLVGDGRTLPAGVPDELHCAYSITMFQHIPYDAMWGYLHQVHERLKPGGVFVFTIAEGDTDEFLNHQIPNPTQFGWDLADLFDRVSVSPADERGWVWVEAWKDE